MERKDRNTYMTNYVRLCFVAQYENRNLLEELLKNQISLGHKLQLKRIHSVFFNYEEAVFIRECIEQNCFEKLDLRLLYLLIRNLQLVQPPSRRLSSNSYPKVLTIEDGVELIYQKYNLILHSGKTSFTNEEVRELFSIFNDIAITFDHFCMNNTGNKSVTRYIETCCVDYKMRSRYRNHLHVLEMNLKETKGPRYYPRMYGREEFQLPPEITNYMRVIYAIQVGLTDEVRKCMASRLPPEYLCREIMTSQFFDELPLTIKNIIGQCRHHGYKHFSLYLIRLLMINKFISFETFDIKWILTERDKIIYRGNAGLTDTEMGKIFSVLIQIAKDLELEMKAPLDSIVAKLEYYKTCCMDERTFEWFKEGLTYIAAKEQEFGTFRNNPESIPRYWYLPPGHDLEHLQIPESRYTLIGYAFEDTLSTILRELLYQIVPPVVIFNWIVLSDHSVRYFNATEYLKFLESQENGYTDFDTMLLSSALLQLQKKEIDAKVLEAIKKTKQELQCRRNKELTDTETMYYFNVFKDVARMLDRILTSTRQKCVPLVEQLENLLTEADQLKHLFASLLKKKSQKPVWMEKGRFGKTPSLLDSREFYELLEHGFYDSYENRVYLGGPCNAGKTSLACVLTGDEVPDKWISTNGLQIYFGQNGIHLKDKKMIQIRKGMLCHTVHGKVIAAMTNIQKEEVASNKVEKKEMVDFEVGQSFALPEFEDAVPIDEWFHLKQTLTDEMEIDEALGNDLDKDITQQMKYGSIYMKSNFDIQDLFQFDSTPELIRTPTLNRNDGNTAEKEKKTENSYPEYLKELTSKASALSNTSNVLQEEDLRKSILDEIRRGEYNLEIAPSDLVDFGGQKAFDMTHQLFILQEGTVLLLFDGSKDLDEPLPEYPGKNISSADILLHWVNSVSTYCTEDSGIQRIQFVATHRDRYKTNYEIRRTELVAQLTKTFKEHVNKSHLFLDNLFFIDARKKDDNEIDKLKDKLVQIAFSQNSWGMKMPLIWVPLEKQIIDLKLRGTSILRMEEIQKLNRLNEDLMMDDEKLNFFLRTQHAIGKLIFFDQDELSQFIIIEPSVLVNALRSFVTDEMFFPAYDTEYYNILKNLQEDGMLKKNDLMKLWNQDEFQAIFKNQEFKDFLVKILLHLDVLVEPKLVNQEVNVPPEYYIIPCMIQTRLNNDYAEKYLNINKSICMAYDFKIQLVPPCVLFRLIAAALGIWPLKVYQGRKMIFQDIATFVFDEINEFSIIMQGRKIIIYFTNLNSIRNIQSPNVASVQECLTIAMLSISEFYQLNSRRIIDALNRSIFEKQFELEYGAACKTPCFVKKFEELRLSKDGMWECQHGQFHEVDYLRYWDSKQNQKNAQKIFKMTDTYISPTILMKKPPADLLRKVSFAVGIDGANLGSNLGIESTVIANMVIGKRYNIFEKTQRILGYWEMLCDPVTIKQLVKALEKIGGRGLETIVDYYSFSNKPTRRGRSKSCPLLISSHEYITENKGNNVLYKHTFSSDGFFVDCIVAKGINLRVKAEKDECSNRLIDCESVYHRHLLLQRRIDSRYYNSSKLREELTDAIQAKDSLLFRHILAYWNPFKSDITLLKQLLDLAIKNQCGCCAKAIAWQITRLFLKEVSVPECCDIWPGFRCACKFWNARHGEDSIYFCSPDVVIIVEVSAQVNECEPNSFYGIPIRYEKQISNSQEGKLITEKITSLQNQDPEWVSKVTGIDGSRAKHYFAQHRKLSVISPSPIKSQGYPIKQIIVKEPCIQLYCRLKGYIPVGEAHFPYEIDGIPTDILQGYAELLVEDIRIGSEVGRLGGKSGTLGGFVRYLGKDAFLTCAHVIIDKEYLVTKENRQKIHENTINVYYINQGSLPGTNALPCGELINFAFPPDESDGTTVDAAIIQLDKTCVKINPQNMVFDQNSIARSITDMGMSSEYLNKCCLDYKEVGTILELQMRSSGSVSGLQQCQDKIVIEKERRQELQTFIDSVSEMVIRNPKSDDISEFIHFKEQVKTVADGELRSPRVFTVYNQLSFSKIAFQLGDSGTCIYAVGPNGITGCIGMAIASHPAGGCIVTPIKAILSSFRML